MRDLLVGMIDGAGYAAKVMVVLVAAAGFGAFMYDLGHADGVKGGRVYQAIADGTLGPAPATEPA